MKMQLRFVAEVMLVFVCLSADKAFAQPKQTKPIVESVHSVGMTVVDMDRSLAVYTKVLSFEKVSDVEVWCDEFDRHDQVLEAGPAFVIEFEIEPSGIMAQGKGDGADESPLVNFAAHRKSFRNGQ